MAKKQIDLGLTGLDELFMDDRERAESKLPKIHEIPLSEIDEFPNHPFHVRIDEDMDQLVESIKERGIITPVTLRQKPDGRYEIVSGHRRTKACELAGLATVKAEIKELSQGRGHYSYGGKQFAAHHHSAQRKGVFLQNAAGGYKQARTADGFNFDTSGVKVQEQ